MLTKICKKCNRELPATTEYFHKNPGGKYGLNSICKNCKRTQRKLHTENHREEIRGRRRIYNERSKEKIKIFEQNYKQYRKLYREVHKEEIRARNKAYNERHREKLNIYYRSYNAIHQEERRIYYQQWAKTNPDKIRAKNVRGIALKRAASVIDFSLVDWLASQSQPFRCYLCGKLIRKNQKYHIEHRIPLSRGGLHAPWNLGLAHEKCNLSKHTKTPWEYKPEAFQPELSL